MSKKSNLKNSFTLGILILFCVTPFFLAQWIYYHRASEVTQKLGTVNHGKLIRPLITLNQIIDTNTALPALNHHWSIFYVSTSKDKTQIDKTLDKIYRIRLALGKDFSQVGEVFGTLKSNVLESNLLNIPEIILSPQGLEKLLTYLNTPQGIFLIDPAENVFMGYPDNVNSEDIYQDIRRLISTHKV